MLIVLNVSRIICGKIKKDERNVVGVGDVCGEAVFRDGDHAVCSVSGVGTVCGDFHSRGGGDISNWIYRENLSDGDYDGANKDGGYSRYGID